MCAITESLYDDIVCVQISLCAVCRSRSVHSNEGGGGVRKACVQVSRRSSSLHGHILISPTLLAPFVALLEVSNQPGNVSAPL